MGKQWTVAIAACVLCGCGESSNPRPESAARMEQAVLKIKVFTDGSIIANDEPVDMEQLTKQLSQLKESGGSVWYYREAADSEPHQNAMRVMQLIVENELPISFSTASDFSNVVGSDGIPRDR